MCGTINAVSNTATDETIRTQNSSSRGVKFSDIEIREYEMTASDNPGVSKGPGIGIGWKYVEMESLSVELFEKHHPPRRSMKEIKVTTRERMDRLRDSGYTQREIQQIVKQINIAKRKRQGTLDRMKLHTAHEKVSHFVHRLFKRRWNCERQTSRSNRSSGIWLNRLQSPILLHDLPPMAPCNDFAWYRSFFGRHLQKRF